MSLRSSKQAYLLRWSYRTSRLDQYWAKARRVRSTWSNWSQPKRYSQWKALVRSTYWTMQWLRVPIKWSDPWRRLTTLLLATCYTPSTLRKRSTLSCPSSEVEICSPLCKTRAPCLKSGLNSTLCAFLLVWPICIITVSFSEILSLRIFSWTTRVTWHFVTSER